MAKPGKKTEYTEIPYRSLYLTEGEVEYIRGLVEKANKIDPLIKRLDQVLDDFNSNVKRLEEITAREKANAFWQEPQHRINEIMKEERKARQAKIDKQISCLQAKEMRRKLRKKEKAERVRQIREYNEARQARIAAEGQNGVPMLPVEPLESKGDLVEKPVQLELTQPEEQPSPLPPVMGNEGQDLIVE